jgi:pimeloyl-ACP methyl ester carboxylesterase
LIRLLVVALVVGLVGGVAGYGLLTSALYVHAFTHPGCGEMGIAPADVGVEDAQDATYSSHDGLTLRAWYLPPQNGAVVILLPGLGGARDGMVQEGAILARHGYGLLMTELRSCAHPEGQTTLGYREAADLAEAVTWVRGQPGVARVGVLGYSLGGATAILGAAQDERIEAVVAEGGFYDLAGDIANEGGDDPLWQALIYRSILYFFRRAPGSSTRQPASRRRCGSCPVAGTVSISRLRRRSGSGEWSSSLTRRCCPRSNCRIYDLYGLSEEERRIVEESLTT